jgi:hypothetical protein
MNAGLCEAVKKGWDTISTDEHRFPAALTEPAENPESRGEGRMDLPIRRLNTPQRSLQPS